jgi:D-glycero-D-manno-heptose 1,7-bisphosphate phosphatase
MLSKALFLDRDGVINVDHGYVCRPDDFHFNDGIFDLVRYANLKKYKIVVITNQAGIGRGYYTEADFLSLTEWMTARFEAEGAIIDKVYFSPYHPTAGLGRYRRDDFSRKPRPGMIHSAEKELKLELSSSILIGDKPSDIEAGLCAGIGKSLLYAEEDPLSLQGIDYTRITSLIDALAFFPEWRPRQKEWMC